MIAAECAGAVAAPAGAGPGATGTPRGAGLPATGTPASLVVLAAALILLGLLLRRLGPRRSGALLLGVLVVAGLATTPAREATAAVTPGCVLAGADRSNLSPFTVDAPESTRVDPLSDRATSNPDGRPGGLWDTIRPASSRQVTPSGVWGELFQDTNGNRRHDPDEQFTDDPVNSLEDPDSTGKYDGIYLGGFGNDRIPRGVFDPIWARTVVVKDPVTGKTAALTTLDFIGYFSDRVPLILERARALEPSLRVDSFVVSHTHDHQSIDMIGLWGPVVEEVPRDGTYPRYERYVEEKVARSLVAAYRALKPARFKAGSIRPGEPFRTARGNREDLGGLQTKGTCRTPWLFDDELRAFQLQGYDGRTIATGINWAMHVESMEDGNQYLSSDNAHTARLELEGQLGGVALYLPGAQGSVEVVGDSCTRRWKRTVFDGERFAVRDNGSPAAFVYKPGTEEWADPVTPRRRTYALGRVIGAAAAEALRRAPWDSSTTMEVLPPRDAYLPTNNGALLAVVAAGTVDKPSYAAGQPLSAAELTRRLGLATSPVSGFDVKTTFFAWRIGSASFLTAPGELFPELWLGVAEHNRAATKGEYVRVNPAAIACSKRPFAYSDDPAQAGAHTGRPYEPGVRDAVRQRFGTRTNFLLGYAPDLLGYIVPGYDFDWYVAPAYEGVSLSTLVGEAPDPCQASPPDLAFPEAKYTRHYHETNGASSVLAGGVTCGMLELLQGAAATTNQPACAEFRGYRNGVLLHVGVGPVLFDPASGSPPVGHY
jgi:hypothetical protein